MNISKPAVSEHHIKAKETDLEKITRNSHALLETALAI